MSLVVEERLRKKDWTVESIPLRQMQELVAQFHYAGSGSNTATFRHGLFRRDDFTTCSGGVWWLPPTKSAAMATFPEGDWRRVLSLSRMVIAPGVPKNACSFLLSRSINFIRADGRWDVLVTYADSWQGHGGGVYLASGWEHVGTTKPEATWVTADGHYVARKAGPHTRTKSEMEALGYTMIGRFSKEKFILRLRPHSHILRGT